MESPPSNNTTKLNDTGLTLLDRSIPVVLPHPDDTASRHDNISPSLERLHRLHGTSIILDVSKLLDLSASTYATACTVFHRFYQRVSLTDHDVWSVALASILLATKVEEETQSLKTIVHAFCHVYRKRILVVIATNMDTPQGRNWNHPCWRYLSSARSWSLEQKEQFLANLPLPSKLGPVFDEWHKQALHSEAILLRQLGFTLYWIPDSHPHKFILYFCQALDLTQPPFTQRAWKYCNDSCRLDLCVRFSAEIVATSSIFLSAQDFSLELPMKPQPWWEVLVGKNSSQEIVTAANSIRGLCALTSTGISYNNTDHCVKDTIHDDVFIASKGYVVSCKKNDHGSFTDPGGFLWDQLEDALSSSNSDSVT